MDYVRSVRCHAHSSKTGKPCQRWAIRGGVVCTAHGGSAGHVREAARRRLEEMVPLALRRLRELIEKADSDSVSITAIRDLLDRVGMKPVDRIESDSNVTISVVYEEQPISHQGVVHTNGHTRV